MDSENKLYLGHILDAITKLEKYAGLTSRTDLETNDLVYDAIVREIEILGEATKHLTDDFRCLEQGIPWNLIIATRNKLIHEYSEVDLDSIWKTIQEDLPKLKAVVNKYLN
ncbi:MAG: DUF86 domain-containing protein [Candidatus Paceibacterota bacterium]|jgi:uncharacterized protein with HEPN domain